MAISLSFRRKSPKEEIGRIISSWEDFRIDEGWFWNKKKKEALKKVVSDAGKARGLLRRTDLKEKHEVIAALDRLIAAADSLSKEKSERAGSVPEFNKAIEEAFSLIEKHMNGKTEAWFFAPDERIKEMIEHISLQIRGYAVPVVFENFAEAEKEFRKRTAKGVEEPDVIFSLAIDSPDLIAFHKRLVSEIKKVSETKMYLLAEDYVVGQRQVKECGFDGFLMISPIEIAQLKSIFDTIKSVHTERESMHPEELVKEKERFYDKVRGFIAERSEKTANTADEIRIVFDTLKDLGSPEKVKVLDAGCGYGRISFPIAAKGYGVVGVDISGNLLEDAMALKRLLAGDESGHAPAREDERVMHEAEKIHKFIEEHIPDPDMAALRSIKFTKSNLMDLGLKPGSFDAILMMWVVFGEIRGKANRLAVLRGCANLLKGGGILLIDLHDIQSIAKDMNYNGFEDGRLRNMVDASENLMYDGYIPSEEELRLILKTVGMFIDKAIPWTSNTGDRKTMFVCRKIERTPGFFEALSLGTRRLDSEAYRGR